MTTTITTNTKTDVAVKVNLRDILETVFAGNEELKSFDLLSATTSSRGASLIDNGILTFAFSRNEKDEKELKATEPAKADDLPTEREIVREALGTASTFYIGATTEDRAKVEERIIKAWKVSGTGEPLSQFALPYYRNDVRNSYNTSTGRFEFAEPVILDSPPAFAPWQPTADQIAEARDILGIRIPFGQLSEDDKSKAVLEVLRKWHEDGEKDTLRNAGLYVNYFKGSELYLTTEFGKENQGRI